jgi:hypothetical protein
VYPSSLSSGISLASDGVAACDIGVSQQPSFRRRLLLDGVAYIEGVEKPSSSSASVSLNDIRFEFGVGVDKTA